MMEERRVQQSGASTLTVSLPAGWVESIGLAKGDRVLVEPTADGGLTVYPAGGGGAAPRAVAVRARDLGSPEAARATLRALYEAGWERVTLRDAGGLAPAVAAAARRAADGLPGLEVLSETRTELEFAASLDPAAFPLPAVLRRLELTGGAALADAAEALATRDGALAEAARARARDGRRLRRLARRQATVAVARPGLTRVLAGTLRDAALWRTAAEALGDVAAAAERLADETLALLGFDVPAPPAALERLADAHRRAEEARALASGALFGADPARAYRALALAPAARDAALAATRDAAEAGHAGVARRLARVATLLADVADAAHRVAEVALERTAVGDAGAWSEVRG